MINTRKSTIFLVLLMFAVSGCFNEKTTMKSGQKNIQYSPATETTPDNTPASDDLDLSSTQTNNQTQTQQTNNTTPVETLLPITPEKSKTVQDIEKMISDFSKQKYNGAAGIMFNSVKINNVIQFSSIPYSEQQRLADLLEVATMKSLADSL